MGLCSCKCKRKKRETSDGPSDDSFTTYEKYTSDGTSETSTQSNSRSPIEVGASPLDILIFKALNIFSMVVESTTDRPHSLQELHSLADQDSGWLSVINAMIRAIPSDHPHGPALMAIVLEDCPLPAKETVIMITELLPLASKKALKIFQQRNLCIILGFLAEKLPGPISVALLSGGTLDYLIENLINQKDINIILYSLIALEKFAIASENKLTINEKFNSLQEHPIEKYEPFWFAPGCIQKEIGFCAQWAMDNIFNKEGRNYTFETLGESNIKVILNANDSSEYLKISADGLSARNDRSTFESIRCTYEVNEGIYYYEATLITSGVMQIGWATKESKFLNHEGYGIGDDEFSISYDGCRRLTWFKAGSQPHGHSPWKSGDVLGCLINLKDHQIVFALNGSPLPPFRQVFAFAKSGFFAAASFMVFQQCQFNFGHMPFRFPPKNCKYKTFNESIDIQNEAKIILPRHLQAKLFSEYNSKDDCCTICYDNTASIMLHPCRHTGLCRRCVAMITSCPMCRSNIVSYKELTEKDSTWERFRARGGAGVLHEDGGVRSSTIGRWLDYREGVSESILDWLVVKSATIRHVARPPGRGVIHHRSGDLTTRKGCLSPSQTSLVLVGPGHPPQVRWLDYRKGISVSGSVLPRLKVASGSISTPRNHQRYGHLVRALGRTANGAKLPSEGLQLNASKSESLIWIATILSCPRYFAVRIAGSLDRSSEAQLSSDLPEPSSPGEPFQDESQQNPVSEADEGEELFGENLEADYRAIPALDAYDPAALDDSEYSMLSERDRQAAEDEMRARDREEGRETGRMRHTLIYEESDEEDFRPTRRRNLAERAAHGEEVQDVDMVESIDNLEQMRGHSVREWVTLLGPRTEIRNRFKNFLRTFVNSQGQNLYREKISQMCEGKTETEVLKFIMLVHSVKGPNPDP
ncbi:RSPRY1 [Cordylochernes scorpioides]|uniref:RSPRY1 n=1 Tax=Cordylochernes scorpioides TaxID=51811 RepID=A0ABY6L5H3_9ARAC|nr:RSPRY1 [Cordylochernes scorpioides]